MAPALADLAVLVAVYVVTVGVHELGHAAAARVVGHDIFEVQVGLGPAVRTSFGPVTVVIGLFPVGGHVVTGAPDVERFRARAATVAGAGCAANVVVGVAAVAAGWTGFGVFNLIGAAVNLWPFRSRKLGGSTSDGRLLWDLARGRPEVLDEERSGWFCATALRLRERGDHAGAVQRISEGFAAVGGSRSLHAVAGLLDFETGRFAECLAHYRRLVDDPKVAAAGRAGYAADAAWAAVLSRDDDLLAEARQLAELAWSVGPRTERRRLVLAIAVALTGDPGAGEALLGRLRGPRADAVRVLVDVARGDTAAADRRYDREVAAGLAQDHPLRRLAEHHLRR